MAALANYQHQKDIYEYFQTEIFDSELYNQMSDLRFKVLDELNKMMKQLFSQRIEQFRNKEFPEEKKCVFDQDNIDVFKLV